MRRGVSHQQVSDRADETLRALVRLLARAAARQALGTTSQAEAEDLTSLPSEGDDRAS